MFPTNGYPTWRDAYETDPYNGQVIKEAVISMADSIENIESMVTEMYHREDQ